MAAGKEGTIGAEKKGQKPQIIDDKTLEKMAIEEIYRDIAVKSVRAKEIGPSGWLDVACGKTNKRFLRNTLRSTLSHNSRHQQKDKFIHNKITKKK